MLTIVAIMCNIVAGTSPVCREEIVSHHEMKFCFISPAELAQWKVSSKVYGSDNWYIKSIRCEAGGYEPKDAT